MHLPIPITQELLLIGGGHTHALVLRLWGMNPLAGVRVTVVNPAPTAPYSGMLPGYVAGHYTRDELNIDLVRLARFAGARLIRGRAEHVDSIGKTVTLNTGQVLPYDIVSLDIGVTSAMPDLPGFDANCTPAKPLDQFAHNWASFRARAATASHPARLAVIGGGVAGVELTMAMAHGLRQSGAQQPEISLIEQHKILPGMAQSRRQFFKNELHQFGIQIHENTIINSIEPGKIHTAQNAEIRADFVVGAAGARAQDWLTQSALKLHNGYIIVGKTLQSISSKDVYAVGDCAHLGHAPRPKAGVFAVRQAPVLHHNLRASLSGGKLRPFNPQRDYLKLISLGQKTALADKWGIKVRAGIIWRLKDRIDRKFMDQFTTLPPMPTPPRPAILAHGVTDILDTTPLCGGCGAKVGGQALKSALTSLPTVKRPDILTGPGDDAATLQGPNGQFQVISTDHLRAFSNDPGTMARIAAIHALGDIWAMGANAQSALASITLPRLSPKLQSAWLAEITAAAGAAFETEGAAIVGGHSAMGAELSIGFTVTGLCSTPPVGISGAKPGDSLILTKPIGTGVILAAEMAMQAKGRWVMAALDQMMQSQGDVARVLSRANAMCDVTGFGLAGHMAEIAQASGVGFELCLNDIPVLGGALELTALGIRSSIYAENRALTPSLDTPDTAHAHLLFDPQTAGGLLAAIAPDAVENVMQQMAALGCDAKIIGQCTEKSAGQRLI